MIMAFGAMGRAGEVGLASYNLSWWCTIYEAFTMMWQQRKRVTQVGLNWFCDFCCMELDFVHCMACYMLVGADSSSIAADEDTWMFPFLRTNTSSKVTEMLKKFVGVVPGVPDDVTATCLRVGSAMEVTKRTNLVTAVHRGAWDYPMASITTAMEYVTQTIETVSIAGKALAGWPDPTQDVFPPRCEPILTTLTKDGTNRLYNLLNALFTNARCALMSSKLRPFAQSMFASLVMHLSEFIAKYGDRHVVIINLRDNADRVGVSMSTLQQWGDLVRADWKERNKNALAAAVDWRLKINDLERELMEANAKLEKMVINQNQMMVNQNTMMSLLLQRDREPPAGFDVLGPLPAPVFLPASPLPDQITSLITTDSPAVSVPTAPAVPALLVPVPVPGEEPPEKPVRPKPEGAFLPPPPNIVRYELPFKFYDITDLFHDALRVGTAVHCSRKQDNGRLHAVVRHARKLLARNDDEVLVRLRAQLDVAPPPASSPSFPAWKEGHLEACRELKREVQKSMLGPGEEWSPLYSTTITAIGTRLQNMS